jgi:uncharacterized membrane protein
VVRTMLYVFGGLLLGLLVHLVVILTLPLLADTTVAKQIAVVAPEINKSVLLPAVSVGADNPLHLDPDLAYDVCRLDLRQGPGEVTATLPANFWSVAVYDHSGTVIYSTTNRDGIGQNLDVGVFDPAETRLLAEQKIDVDAGLLIVESKGDDVFVVVRLAPPQPAMRSRYETQLSQLDCHTIRL